MPNNTSQTGQAQTGALQTGAGPSTGRIIVPRLEGVVRCTGLAIPAYSATGQGLVQCSGSIPAVNLQVTGQGIVRCSGQVTPFFNVYASSVQGIVRCWGEIPRNTGQGMVHCWGQISGVQVITPGGVGKVQCSGQIPGVRLGVLGQGLVQCSGEIQHVVATFYGSGEGVVHCWGEILKVNLTVSGQGMVHCWGVVVGQLNATPETCLEGPDAPAPPAEGSGGVSNAAYFIAS